MITPMVRELKRTFPDSYIATLTQPSTSVIFDNNPYVDKTITDDLKKESFRDVVRQIKECKFTHGLMVFPTERAAYQMFLGRVKKRYMTGFRLYSAITFIRGVSRNNYTPLRHEADYCMDLARRIGVKTQNIQPEIFVSEEEKKKNLEFLKNKNIPADLFKIIIHTGSGKSSPNWTEKRYMELINMILEKFKTTDFRIILTALEMSEKFLSGISILKERRIVNISEDVKSLRSFICTISNADLIFSSSTGPIHIADALGIKCIGIFCRRTVTSSKHWGVLNEKSVNLEVSNEYCEKNCSEGKAGCRIEDGITPGDVLKHIEII